MCRFTRRFVVASLCLSALAGCVPLPPPWEPVTVILANDTPLDVRPNLYISNTAAAPNDLFTRANLVTNFTDRSFPELRANESVTLTLECDQVQSVGADAPVLFDALTLDVTRSEDRLFLLRDSDFECGATIRLVFFTEGAQFRVRVEFPE